MKCLGIVFISVVYLCLCGCRFCWLFVDVLFDHSGLLFVYVSGCLRCFVLG